MILYHSLGRFLEFKIASGGHLGFVEFLDCDHCKTETCVIPLIPLFLGQ